MLDRRDLLLTGAAAASLAPFGASAQTAEDSKLAALFDNLFEEGLRRRPEGATQLGLDVGVNADLRSRLSDGSAVGLAADRAQNAEQLRRLSAIDRGALSDPAKVNYDTVLYTRRSTAAVQAFDFGGAGFGPSPYIVSQLTGAYQSTPQLLITKHPIENDADADAFLARLAGYAVQLDQDTDRMAHDAGLGVSPPDFLLDTALVQMTAGRTSAADSEMVRSLARRAAAKNLSSRYAEQAGRIYDDKVGPAVDRQIAMTRRLRLGARHDAGLGQFKDGPAFYAAALKATTTTSLSPDEVHKIGLDQGAEISARIDELLKARGLSQGTVGERIAGLYRDPIATTASPPSVRACRPASNACRRTRSRYAACLPTSKPARPQRSRKARRWMARAPASSTSTCTTPRTGRNGPCRPPSSMKGCPVINWRAVLHCPTRRFP
jgi:uncharacterized protein (DUF885 family)